MCLLIGGKYLVKKQLINRNNRTALNMGVCRAEIIKNSLYSLVFYRHKKFNHVNAHV